WLLEEMPLFGFPQRGLVLLLEPHHSFPHRVVARFDEMVLLFPRG
ncbi:hypothetical protein A2U01_0107481, partial [Trifolium medium]|nr:hypothetical protein [Trifolium medium]